MSDESSKKDTKNNKSDKKAERRKNVILDKLSEFRAEFRKIVWPSREDLLKHTATVIVISLLFGAFITVLDGLFGIAYTTFVGLIS